MYSERFMCFLKRPRFLTWSFHLGFHDLNMYMLWNAIHTIVKYLRLNNFHSVRLNKILHRPFNMPYAFSVTTLAPKNLLLKYFCYLSVLFSLYDFNSHENLGKGISPIFTNGIFPKIPRTTFRSGITEPPIISLYIEADFNKCAP